MRTDGERIREAREKKGISQETLARLIDRSTGTVYSWETGRSKISLEDAREVKEDR